jgi:flagellar assembly factor FliW
MSAELTIKTTRFGQVSFQLADLFNFPEGILGFQDLRKFVLLDDPNDDIFAWLQSCEEPGVAFPVLEPELFSEKISINLAKTDLDILRLTDSAQGRQFCIVTIPNDPTLMTANLKAPIVVNVQEKIARQCVLQDNTLAIREPIFKKLQQRVVSNPEKSIKQQSIGLDVAIKLPAPKATLEIGV